MTKARWVLEKDSVCLESEGKVYPVPAELIWSAEFDDISNYGMLDFREPSYYLDDQEFSELAFSPRFQVRKSLDNRPLLWLVDEHEPQTISNPKFVSEDQVFINRKWFYNNNPEIHSILEKLKSNHIELGFELNEAQFMWLVWKSGIDLENVEYPAESVETYSKIKTIEQRHPNVTVELYPYQNMGFRKITELYDQELGCLLADEMGLGKTAQAIAHLSVRNTPEKYADLVVSPSSLLLNWKREIERFSPQLETHIHIGPKRTGTLENLTSKDVIITSYDTLVRDKYLFKRFKWRNLVLDEAQYIKNPSSTRSIIAKIIPSDFRLAITGTPIENSLTDAWSIAEFLVPNHLPAYTDFVENYPDEDWAASKLGELISPLTIRRQVSEVLQDLPKKIESMVPIQWTQEAASEYLNILDSSNSPFEVYTTLSRLCSDFSGGKEAIIYELVENAFIENNKILIFVQFKNSIDDIALKLKEKYPHSYVNCIDGRSAPGARQEIVDAFSRFEGNGILVMNPRAAGVGLNIQAASVVIHLSPMWNPAIVDQATARAFRNGQTKPVFVYTLYLENSLEEIMIERLATKRGLSRHGMNAAAEEPSTSDLMKILSKKPQIQ